jgi:D-beta-D-heptose 7-phosphate kinase/D-beta-D-heptose 1-phosphate adenosyltransferase
MKKIFVNGTFDIVHTGHLLLLNYAKSLGDHLLVAIDSDSRVQRLKGQSRPINDESERTSLLINLRSVDRVRIFETDEDLVNIIATYQPDIMVKGSDYKNQPIIGAEHCKEIAFFERINEYSTTKKIQYIIDRR